LGVAYKPRVPYIYKSQPLEIAERLFIEGYSIHIYDEYAEENAKKILPEATFYSSLKECIENSDVLFVGTSTYSGVQTDKPIVNPWKTNTN